MGEFNSAMGGTGVFSDATYQVEYTEEGVYVKPSYQAPDGKPLIADNVIFDLNRRNITGLSVNDLPVKLRRHDEMILVAEAQEEKDVESDVMVSVSKDNMTAEMMLLPPGGRGRVKSYNEIINLVKKTWEIAYGVKEDAVKRAVISGQFLIWTKIAEGKPPVKGEDGELKFLFNTERSLAPAISEDGSADYKNLNVFEGVLEGQKVAEITVPGKGEEGFTVKGTIIPPKPGAEAKFPKGRNTVISEDGRSMLAAKSGRIDYKNGRIEVSDVYRVNGDVDMSVGNIKFEGDVLVTGNVISGLSIEAVGTVEIAGNVEGATITAGKDIVLRKGMQGMDKGKLVAKGNVVARFLEKCEIEAQGDIVSDYIVQCKATACGSIIMKGKWGKIIGGTVRAGKEVIANTVGSVSNEFTTIEMGLAPEQRLRYTDLIAERNSIKEQLVKISGVKKVMEAKGAAADAARNEMWQKLISAEEQLGHQYDDLTADIEMLDDVMSSKSGSKLHVIKDIFPNVKIIIDSCSITTKNQIKRSTFFRYKGEITTTMCEL